MRLSLTDASVKNAKPKGKPYRLFDGGGLYLEVAPGGGKWWRLKYRFEGKEKRAALGVYPSVGLKEARLRRDAAKELLARGIDPLEKKKADKEAAKAAERDASLTFAAIGNQWFEKHCADTVPTTQKKTRWYLDTLFECIGNEPFAGLGRKALVDAVKDLQDRISPHMAHRAAGVLNRVCLYAWDCGYTDRNLADRISSALKPHKGKH
jgi:hypothetical protein